jgi:hypothetical protein
LLSACNKAPHNNSAIRQAVVDHLNKGSGLNLAQVDIDVTNVAYQGENKAIATVFFRPKSNPDQGMTMNYTLEAKGNKWGVTGRPGLAGGSAPGNPHGGMGAGGGLASGSAIPGAEGTAGQLPPGHPPLSGADKGASKSGAPAQSGSGK